MAPLRILQEPSRTLRKGAKAVPLAEINSPAVKKLLKEMSEILRATKMGIGLAAPQVGKSLRIFIVSEEALRGKTSEKRKEEWKHLVFINPRIIKSSKKRNFLTEGCLSVSDPGGRLVFGKIKRFDKVAIEAWDETGRKFRRGASGLFAQALQHETDHLDGILFTDKAEEIHRLDL